MSKYLVLGAGQMGYACVYDLAKHSKATQITVIDIDKNKLKNIEENIQSDIIKTKVCSIEDTKQLSSLMSKCDTVLSAISYKYNYELSKLAIKNNANFCDLGGNNDIVEKQYSLHEKAKAAGVTIIPDLGLAPGLICNLGMMAIKEFETVEELKLRVGGLPQNPEPPMNYSLFFSTEGLINEYYEPPVVVENYKIVTGEPLGDLETVSLTEYPELEAFNTSGGLSTLPENAGSHVKNLNYKTIRYKGHHKQAKLLFDLGFMNPDKLEVFKNKISPRDILIHQLNNTLTVCDRDVILLKVTANGEKDNQFKQINYEIVAYFDENSGLSAMMRMTAFPASIIAQMITENKIKEKGVVPSELVVDCKKLLSALEKRNIILKYT